MKRLLINIRRHRRLLAGLLLAVFAVRAWVPAGFMPAPGQPFELMICAMDMQGHSEGCTFSAVSATGPVAHVDPPSVAWIVDARIVVEAAAAPCRFLPIPGYQSRAPPIPA